jgi:hypothetical protein
MFKRIMVAVAFGLMAIAAQAEATFDQIQGLIQQQQYAAAAQGLEVIIQNHPKSAKAFYAMAQAQAGLGNQEKAQKALNIATGLNPTLDFAPASSVQSLKDAITPQVKKIESIEESHTARNVMILLVLAVSGFAIWFAYGQVKIKREEDAENAANLERIRKEDEERRARNADRRRQEAEQAAKEIAEHNAKEAALKAHPNYGHERFDSANPDKLKSVKQFKEEQAAAKAAAELREAKARANAAEAAARQAQLRATYNVGTPAPAPTPTTTVVHTNSGSNDMLTGVLIGNMLSGSHHDHNTTVIRETVREVETPAKAPRSSWDDIDTTPSKSSSWDDTPSRSSSRSSSWDSDSSSSSSSSSWSSSSSDSGSSWSSSDSSSSSSWD